MSEPARPDDGDEFEAMTPDEVAAADAAEALGRPAPPPMPRMIVTKPDTYTPPPFSPEQATRAEALRVSRDIVLSRGSSLFGSTKVDVGIADLVDLAVFIVDGIHPLDRYEPEPAVVIEEEVA